MSVPRPDPDPALVLEHAPYVRALARELVFDRHLARDLEQEVLLAALENAPRDPRSIRGWLAAIVRNLAAKSLRSSGRRQEREARAARAEDAVPTPAELLAREDLRRWLLEHLLALEAPLRDVLILRFVEELPPREVARRLAIPVETARSRAKRGLVELRARLDRDARGRNGAWCVALVEGLRVCAPSVVGAGCKLLGPALLGVLAVSSVQKALSAAVIVVLAVGAFVAYRSFEPLRGALEAPPLAPSREAAPLSAGGTASEAGASERRAEGDAAAPPAPAAAASAPTSLELVLHWHDGTPAADVSARVYFGAATDFYVDTLTLTTGADGRALAEDVPAGPASAYLDRGPSGECRIAPGTRGTIELTLERGFDIAGVVEERGGRPIAGAELFCDPAGTGWSALRTARTDSQGRFRIRSIRPGVCWISARAPQHPPSAQHEFVGGEVDLENVRIQLDPAGASIAGRVLDARGEPLARAEVLVGREESWESQPLADGHAARVPSAQLARCDEAGRFRVAGVAVGKLELQARGPGCAPWKGEVETASGAESTLVIRMQAGARLAGRVSGQDGKPLGRAQIRSGEYGFASRFVRSDAEGRFRLENLPLGEFEVSARVDGLVPAKERFLGAGGVELEWNPVLGAGLAIRGRLVGEGLDFSKWWLFCESEDWEKAPYGQSATPRSDGSFEFAGCGDAQHRIRVHAPDASLYPVVTLQARPGGEPLLVTIDAARVPSCRARGRILGENGPLAGAQFNLVAKGQNLSPIETAGPDGRFDVGLLPPGEYTLFVRVPEYCMLRSEAAELAPRASHDFGDLQLVRGGRIALRFARASALEAGHAAIELERGEAGVGWIGLERGAGVSGTLEPGEYELHAWIDGEEQPLAGAPVRVLVRLGEETRVELAPR